VTSDPRERERLAAARTAALFDQALAGQRALERRVDNARRESLARAWALNGSVRWLGVLSVVGVLAAVGGIGMSLRRAVAIPASALRRASGRLAAGDLTTPVRVPAANELSEVAGDLEVMRRRLVGRIAALNQLRQLSARVAGATSMQQLCEVALAGLAGEVGATRATLAVTGDSPADDSLILRGLAGLPEADLDEYMAKAAEAVAGPLPDQRLLAGDVVGISDLLEEAEWPGHTVARPGRSVSWPSCSGSAGPPCSPSSSRAACWACSGCTGTTPTSWRRVRRRCSGWPATSSPRRSRPRCATRRPSGRRARPRPSSTPWPTASS
jgi:HAMP domain-containing protein